MTTPNPNPYRTELDALLERKAMLERDLARVRGEAAQLEALRHEEVALARQIQALEARLGGGAPRRSLPLLDRVTVASPCNAEWNEMVGDERVRFCLSCEKNVYNLSAMADADAEALLASKGDLCVRFYRRADGTVMTADCPVGQAKKRRKMAALAIAGAASLAASALLSLRSRFSEATCDSLDRSHYVRDFRPDTTAAPVEVQGDPRPRGNVAAGGVGLRPLPPQDDVLMGKRVAPPPRPPHAVKGRMMLVK